MAHAMRCPRMVAAFMFVESLRMAVAAQVGDEPGVEPVEPCDCDEHREPLLVVVVES